jgi:hypothetical protein
MGQVKVGCGPVEGEGLMGQLMVGCGPVEVEG